MKLASIALGAAATVSLTGCTEREPASEAVAPAQTTPADGSAVPTTGASAAATAASSGTASATQFAGTITGNGMVRHSFTAREGQTITIERAGDSPMPYFNLMPPGGQPGDQLVVGMMHDSNRWSGPAPVTGTYTAELYLRGAAKDEQRSVPYRLTVTVR